MKNKKPFLIINAALGGNSGNTAKLLKIAERKLSKNFDVDVVCLKEGVSYKSCREKIRKSVGFIIGTGTHWESWSSLLQKFIEDATPDEGSKVWLGKPCGLIVTMHATGGSGVLTRLMATMNLMGCYTPPICAMSYSLAEHIALSSEKRGLAHDFWSPHDVETICYNLVEAINGTRNWKFWRVDKAHSHDVWLK